MVLTKNQTNRDRQAVATKSKIYRCGVQLINQYGYDHITVAQIAKKRESRLVPSITTFSLNST